MFAATGRRTHLLVPVVLCIFLLARWRRAGSVEATPTAALYTEQALAFIGGYTVEGHALAYDGDMGTTLATFTVAQECICTATGTFARGADAENAFLLIASREPDGQWYAQQTSIGVAPAYRALMRFGATPGGTHSAVGFHLTPTGNEQV